MTLPKTKAFIWKKDRLLLLDQRHLPHKTVWRVCRTWQQVGAAIRDMVVRGAPAIGCVAAYGVVLGARQNQLHQAIEGLPKARPTAVNLKWAVERMARVAAHRAGGTQRRDSGGGRPLDSVLMRSLDKEARLIEAEDRSANIAMGVYGASLLPNNATVLTICNTGSLATAGLGTAFGVIWTAHRQGKLAKVLACETRPYLQGARLTAWELHHEKIPFELITDSMAAHLMKTERIHAVIAGADRIAANGDTANKIGTYALAVLALHHEIPFYIAAPSSTIDMATPSGEAIPIEERSADEVTRIRGLRIAPEGIRVRHPAFDVTPGRLIRAFVTEKGISKTPHGLLQNR